MIIKIPLIDGSTHCVISVELLREGRILLPLPMRLRVRKSRAMYMWYHCQNLLAKGVDLLSIEKSQCFITSLVLVLRSCVREHINVVRKSFHHAKGWIFVTTVNERVILHYSIISPHFSINITCLSILFYQKHPIVYGQAHRLSFHQKLIKLTLEIKKNTKNAQWEFY